jgi:hypothetical protein
MATVLDSTTLADPAAGREGYRRTEIDVGAVHAVASGALVYDYVGARYRHALSWVAITAAQRNTIRAEYEDAKEAAVSFTAPDGGGYTVLAVPNSWAEDYVSFDGGTTKYYYVSLELEDSS